MIAVLDARNPVAEARPGTSPEETAARLKSLNDEIAACRAAGHDAGCRSAVLHFRLGTVLLEERFNFAHGDWLAWLNRCGVEHRRAQRAMQIARYFQEEWRLAGLTYRQALRRSSKPEEEVAGNRRRMISRLKAMRTEVRKIVKSLVRQPLGGGPLVQCIDDLAADMRLLQHCCTADRAGQRRDCDLSLHKIAAKNKTRG